MRSLRGTEGVRVGKKVLRGGMADLGVVLASWLMLALARAVVALDPDVEVEVAVTLIRVGAEVASDTLRILSEDGTLRNRLGILLCVAAATGALGVFSGWSCRTMSESGGDDSRGGRGLAGERGDLRMCRFVGRSF